MRISVRQLAKIIHLRFQLRFSFSLAGKFSQAMETNQVSLTFLNRCTVKSENVSGDSVIHHRKRKKQRSVPAHSYPVALTQNTYSQV